MLLDVLVIASPCLLVAFGALVSEYAGVMAIFLEGCINMGAFFCFAFSALTGSVAFGIAGSCAVCMAYVFGAWLFVQKAKADIYLVGAGLNILSAGIIPVFSKLWFGTSGVVAAGIIEPSAFFVRGGSTLMCLAFASCFVFAMLKTPWGLAMRICGTQKDVVKAAGVKPELLQCESWLAASAFAALAGSVLAIRLQSFVPNISSGKGWIALAVVFLGRKNIFGVVLATLLFAAAEYASNRLQGLNIIKPAMLLAMPYIVALLLFAVVPSKKR